MNDLPALGKGALAGLIGEYGSDDSSCDEEMVESRKPVKQPTAPVQQPVWSVCVDPATGCPYYWEQLSNQVCWEPPQGLEALLAAAQPPLPGDFSSQHTPWTNRPAIAANRNKQPNNVPAVGNRGRVPVQPAKLRPPTPSSEEEEEKIELITSYHNSDSGTDDESDVKGSTVVRVYPRMANNSKSKDIAVDKSAKKAKIPPGKSEPLTYGPELPNDIVIPSNTPPKESEIIIGPTLPPELENCVAVGPSLPDDLKVCPDVVKDNEKSVEIEAKQTDSVESPPEVLEDIKIVGDESQKESVKEESVKLDENTEDNDNKSSEVEESDNLDELMLAQAKLLKKLGDLVPSEIEFLVGSPKTKSQGNSRSNSLPGTPPIKAVNGEKKPAALDMDVDDLIAQIEKEQPIDQPGMASDALSVDTTSMDESNTEKSVLEDHLDTKSQVVFKPLFPSAKTIGESMEPLVKESEIKAFISKEVNVVEDNIQSEVNTKIEDVKVVNKYEINMAEIGMESSAFKRKRRIALDVLPAKKITKSVGSDVSDVATNRDISYTTKYAQNFETNGGRMGLGFTPEDFSFESEFLDKKSSYDDEKKSFSNFKKGGIMFQKGETLNPVVVEESENKVKKNEEVIAEKELIEAKLKFLTQSLPPVPPMQQLLIELQTLWGLWEAGAGAPPPALSSWLSMAGQALARLEARAAPAPWTCRFTRYTHHHTTYPVPTLHYLSR